MSYRRAVLASRPAAYLPLDEHSTLRDWGGIAGRAPTGITGTYTIGATKGLIDTGRSLYLGGTTTTYVTLPSNILDWTLACSVECWVVWNSVSGHATIAGITPGAHPADIAYLLWHQDTLGMGVHTKAASTDDGILGATLPVVGQLYHLVVTMPGDTSTPSYVFINGKQDASGVITRRANPGTHRIGATPDTFWGCLNGWVGHLAWYQRQLSRAEVLDHYSAGLAEVRPIRGPVPTTRLRRAA